ncbi:MAG: hypothetical protein LBL82_00090 [Oscillospiraceae bacterium]|jgi:hypothetical protein|nr:hypothetical protein [Oscillospiraceae bacterium]
MKKSTKKILLLSAIGVAVVLISIAAVFAVRVLGDTHPDGVRKVELTQSSSGEQAIRVTMGWLYSENAGYSVRMMEEDEPVFRGERLIENDGSLGKYRIEIMFHDAKGSDELREKYPVGETCELSDVPASAKGEYKIWIAYPPDDSMFVVYIGSDQPIDVEEHDTAKFGDLKNYSFEIKLG